MKQVFVLSHPTARRRAVEAVQTAPDGYVVRIGPPTRSLEANAAMWGALSDISNQVEWYGRKLTPENWKHVFSASLKKQDVVPGLHGDFVVLGISTSKMTKAEMSDLIELIRAFGVEHNVVFGDEQEAA